MRDFSNFNRCTPRKVKIVSSIVCKPFAFYFQSLVVQSEEFIVLLTEIVTCHLDLDLEQNYKNL